MDSINIRRATINDLPEIQKLNSELFEVEFSNYDSTIILDWPMSKDGAKYFSDAISKEVVLVACINEKVVGYLAGTLNSQYSYNSIKQAELDNMCVTTEYRGKGIGKMLFEKFKEICKQNNINEIKVIASYQNVDAISFYKNNGFGESELTLKQKI